MSESPSTPRRTRVISTRLAAAAVLVTAAAALSPTPATSAVRAQPPGASSATPHTSGGSLESAASKAGQTGRKVAMSLLALGLAIAAIVLAFKRDFREAAGVFAVGIVAVLLATPAGLNLLQDTVSSLFGTP